MFVPRGLFFIAERQYAIAQRDEIASSDEPVVDENPLSRPVDTSKGYDTLTLSSLGDAMAAKTTTKKHPKPSANVQDFAEAADCLKTLPLIQQVQIIAGCLTDA